MCHGEHSNQITESCIQTCNTETKLQHIIEISGLGPARDRDGGTFIFKHHASYGLREVDLCI